jgi:hypothetical protein
MRKAAVGIAATAFGSQLTREPKSIRRAFIEQ